MTGQSWIHPEVVEAMTAGCVPAEIARALVGSASSLKNAAAICERPALCTQAKTIFFIVRPRRGDGLARLPKPPTMQPP